jgi:hypothetical protein
VLASKEDSLDLKITCIDVLTMVRLLSRHQLPTYNLKGVCHALHVGPPISFFHRADIDIHALALTVADMIGKARSLL